MPKRSSSIAGFLKSLSARVRGAASPQTVAFWKTLYQSRLFWTAFAAIVITLVYVMSHPKPTPPPYPGQPLARAGDEIVVCGQLFHTGTPIVLWMDPGGYDAYRVERRFAPMDESSWDKTRLTREVPTPNRYGLRQEGLSPDELERVRGGGWDLPLLQKRIDQFVIHYDTCGVSRECFKVLHDHRGLSVHFMLDLDGTIYQTMDLKERAWHATVSNTRGIGIEIANVGAYGTAEKNPFDAWYKRDAQGRTVITLPAAIGDGGIKTPRFVGRPARDNPITGPIHGVARTMYDLTPQQYDALAHLTATLCTVFPKLPCQYPRDQAGLVTTQLTDEQLQAYHGLIGHFHIQKDKIDPGPAFQWDLVVDTARELMRSAPKRGG